MIVDTTTTTYSNIVRIDIGSHTLTLTHADGTMTTVSTEHVWTILQTDDANED